jgi:hypothetical protein
VSVVWERSRANSMYDYGIPLASELAAAGFRALSTTTDDPQAGGGGGSSSSSSGSTSSSDDYFFGDGGVGTGAFFQTSSSSSSDDFQFINSPIRHWTGALGAMQDNNSDALVGLFQARSQPSSYGLINACRLVALFHAHSCRSQAMETRTSPILGLSCTCHCL